MEQNNKEYPQYIYKYMGNLTYMEDLFKSGTLHFSRVSSFNDPFEFQSFIQIPDNVNDAINWINKTSQISKNELRKLPKSEILEMIHSTTEDALTETLSKVTVCCFSSNCDNILMWSHYANCHKGICFKFDISLCPLLQTVKEVTYDLSMPQFQIEDERNIDKLVFTKSIDWAYEKEYRLLAYNNGDIEFNKKALVQIIFGCSTPKSDIDKIKRFTSIYGFDHVQFAQMRKSKKKYKLSLKSYK